MPLPGSFTSFRAYSDTTYQGTPFTAGQGTVTFTGTTTVQIPLTYDQIPYLPGLTLETIAGEFWLTFPYSNPLTVEQGHPDDHWARFNWEIYEGFRWTDESTTQHTADVWDVDSVAAPEPVTHAGATGYYTTASTD